MFIKVYPSTYALIDKKNFKFLRTHTGLVLIFSFRSTTGVPHPLFSHFQQNCKIEEEGTI